jgi:hypothetical protein
MEVKTTYESDGGNITYLNITATNNTKVNQQAILNISRLSPIISDCSQYLMSILKFRIPNNLAPLFIFPFFPLIVTIEFRGEIQSVPLIFQKTNNDAIYPDGCYSYQNMADMINLAISTAFNNLINKPGQFQPIMTYDVITSLYSIYFPVEWVSIFPHNDPNTPKLWFNNALFWYFQSFPTISNNQTIDQTAPFDYNILCLNKYTNKVPFPINTEFTSFLMTQEFKGFQLLSSNSSILITSNNIPGAPVNIASSFLGSSSTSSSAQTINIIEDFDIDQTQAGSSNSVQTYTSQNNRYTDLVNMRELNNINLALYIFYNEIQAARLIYIPPTFAISFKIMFKRKTMQY